MLIAKVTMRAGGFHLSGDSLDLEALYASLHAICEDESDDSDYPENLVMQLAYDVRKAKDGQRAKTKVQSFADKPVTYHSVTLSLVRAVIQFAFVLRIVTGKSIPLKHTASIHAFGATIASALEQLDFPSPEKFIASVAVSVNGWQTWPPSFLVDQIDLRHLFHNQTKSIRVKELMLLPEYLRKGGTFANTVLKARDDYAAERGVDPRIVHPNWPEELPKY